MAWVRTALALISFGFTIAKFFEFLEDKQGGSAPRMGPRTVGIVMIAAGLVSLALSTVQHRGSLKRLRATCPDLPVSLSEVAAVLLPLLGILALAGAVVRN